jgi:cytochrome c556
MIYAETLLEGPLKSGTRNEEAVKTEGDAVRRSAELMAVVGHILRTEGMVDADDDDYKTLCAEFVESSRSVSLALDQGDAAAVARAVGAISQSCAKCHESYR